jgi:hypothetical protein
LPHKPGDGQVNGSDPGDHSPGHGDGDEPGEDEPGTDEPGTDEPGGGHGGATTTTEAFTVAPEQAPPTTERFSIALTPDTTIPRGGGTAAASSALPYTGTDPAPFAAVAFGLVGGGMLVVWGVRRRPRHARGS